MKQWLKLQKDLYQKAVKEAEILHGPRSLSLKSYERAYRRDFQDLMPTKAEDFHRSLQKADVFLLGDFHPLRQSQRMLLRLLRDSKISIPDFLGIEILQPKDEKTFNKLLQTGRFSALQALLKVEERFGSSFETYREIFQVCKQKKIRILALGSSSKNLKRRDQEAAQRLTKVSGRVWILFGEYHCARTHLPLEIKKIKPRARILILQQNEDSSALKRMAHLTKERTVFLKSTHEDLELFCVLHTPLWVKWQSFIDRHLRTWSDDEYALPAEVDAQEQVTWSLKTLFEFLDDPRYPLSFALKEILDFELHSSDEPTFYRALGKLRSNSKKSVLRQLKSSNAAVAARERILFLSEVTLNSCAHIAASFFFREASYLGNQDLDFYRGTLAETFSFFLSKILNHSRRAQSWADWKALAKDSGAKSEAQAVLRTEGFSMHFADRRRWMQSLGNHSSRAQSALGRIIGDSVFEAFLSGEFSKERLQRILTNPIESETEAFEILVELKSVGAPFERRV